MSAVQRPMTAPVSRRKTATFEVIEQNNEKSGDVRADDGNEIRLLEKYGGRAGRPGARPAALSTGRIVAKERRFAARAFDRRRDKNRRDAQTGDKGENVVAPAALATLRPTMRLVVAPRRLAVVARRGLRTPVKMAYRVPAEIGRRRVAETLDRKQTCDHDGANRPERKMSRWRKQSHESN